jgi:flagellar hook-basal body complex protein FliE
MSLDPLLPHLHFQRTIRQPESPKTVAPDQKTSGPSFKSYMKDQIQKVNEQQKDAQVAMEKWATGETDNLSEVMTTVQKSEVAFNMLLEVRNKLLEAYQDITRMQI